MLRGVSTGSGGAVDLGVPVHAVWGAQEGVVRILLRAAGVYIVDVCHFVPTRQVLLSAVVPNSVPIEGNLADHVRARAHVLQRLVEVDAVARVGEAGACGGRPLPVRGGTANSRISIVGAPALVPQCELLPIVVPPGPAAIYRTGQMGQGARLGKRGEVILSENVLKLYSGVRKQWNRNRGRSDEIIIQRTRPHPTHLNGIAIVPSHGWSGVRTGLWS